MRVSIPEHVVSRTLERETVLLNLETGTYFGLNAVGSRMWEALRDRGNTEAAAQQLLAEFDISEDLLRSDLERLVSQLLAKGLIQTLE